MGLGLLGSIYGYEALELQTTVLLLLGNDQHRLEEQHLTRLVVLLHEQALVPQFTQHAQICNVIGSMILVNARLAARQLEQLTWSHPAIEYAGQLLDTTLLLLLTLHLVYVMRYLSHYGIRLSYLLHIAVLAQALKVGDGTGRLLL